MTHTHTHSKLRAIPFPHYVSFLKQNRTFDQANQIYQQRISDAQEIFTKFSRTFFSRDCPACGSSLKRDLPPFQNIYLVKACNSCLTQYVDPCPSLEALTYYYNECKCNALLGDLLRSRHNTKNIILSERTEFVLDLISRQFSGRNTIRVLEIGCSSGAFLAELKDAAKVRFEELEIIYFGIDIDKIAVSKNLDPEITLYSTSAEAFAASSNDTFDLILHFELIEHLQDPFSFMKSIQRLLSKSGLHHFHTPNANGLDNKALGYNDFRPLAHGIFPPMHLQAFTPMNITHFALRSGFNVLQIDTPGNFDVDIVKTFGESAVAPFQYVQDIPDEFLAVFQQWLKILSASSHMRVTLTV